MRDRSSTRTATSFARRSARADGSTSTTARAVELMFEILSLVDELDPNDVAYVAWHATKMTNDLCYAASPAGTAQRQRLRPARAATRVA